MQKHRRQLLVDLALSGMIGMRVLCIPPSLHSYCTFSYLALSDHGGRVTQSNNEAMDSSNTVLHFHNALKRLVWRQDVLAPYPCPVSNCMSVYRDLDLSSPLPSPAGNGQ